MQEPNRTPLKYNRKLNIMPEKKLINLNRKQCKKDAVLITATSSGIGAACAKNLAHDGFLVFAGVRNLAAGELLKKDTKGQIIPILLDVRKVDLIQAAYKQIKETLWQTDIQLIGIVNNATNEYHGPLEILPFEFIREEIEVDYLGAIAVIKTFLPLIRKSGGRIVNMSSMNGRTVFRRIGANSAAKYAIEAMSDALRLELEPWGIRVSIIEPGAVATPIWDKALQKFKNLPDYISKEQLDLYYPSWPDVVKQATLDKERSFRSAMPVEHVVKRIRHALTDKNPKIRYIVGRDAKLIIFLKWILPVRLFDKIAKKMFNEQ